MKKLPSKPKRGDQKKAGGGCPGATCSACGQRPRREVDYGDFSQYEVRCLVAEYCMSVTLGHTGWGVDFKTWVELRGIAKHDGMSRLIRLPNAAVSHGDRERQPDTTKNDL